jgi:hypothetical protein
MGFLEDSGLDAFPTNHLKCKLLGASKIFETVIQNATKVTGRGYAIRSLAVHTMKNFTEEKKDAWNKRFERVAEIEKDLKDFINPASEDSKALQQDAMGQLSFQDEYLKPLNFVPFFLLLISMFKVWLVPAMALITPLIAWILPYIFLKFMYKLPISQEQYNDIMKLIWTGNPMDFMKDPKGMMKAKLETNWTTRGMIQTGLMIFSFAQGLIQPIQNAYHLYKTDRMIHTNGLKLLELEKLYREFEDDANYERFGVQFRSSLAEISNDDPRLALHVIIEQPQRFEFVMNDLADLEVQWRVANSSLLNPVFLLEKGEHPLLQAEEIFDVSLGHDAVASSISFTGETHHAVLTGPNGGGKSSFLRAVLQSVLLAQTYGVAPAHKMVLRRFGWICSGLRLQDAPGNLSMFETEVWFAANLLKRKSARGPGLVVYDELFHSTNPPDGIRTAEIFLKRLWQKSNIVSIVSTHVFSLIDGSPDSVQKLCCNAAEKDGKVLFNYKVDNGVCMVSSVKNIWERFGLNAETAVKAPVENLPTEKK